MKRPEDEKLMSLIKRNRELERTIDELRMAFEKATGTDVRSSKADLAPDVKITIETVIGKRAIEKAEKASE